MMKSLYKLLLPSGGLVGSLGMDVQPEDEIAVTIPAALPKRAKRRSSGGGGLATGGEAAEPAAQRRRSSTGR